MAGEIDLLTRAHALFSDATDHRGLPDVHSPAPVGVESTGATAAAHRAAARSRRADMAAARRGGAELAEILAAACRAHRTAHHDTAAVLAAARADAATMPDNPVAARELLHRRLSRLRAQQEHVAAARRRSHRRRADLRGLRYRLNGRRAAGDGRAGVAVRAALSRLGRPYVWGATGPDRFDCSGLVQWAYAQAGIPLNRTTYQQIHQGVAVSPSQVRPGDLVFPHTGHVQIAIGGNMVVEAPQPGATVQISRMGPSVAIRRVG